ncbi:MAG TPA: hypothetical protein VFB81_16805 [Myxococcales bacterium]|nr:hypothetical protein [Myxococcales bacterium]
MTGEPWWDLSPGLTRMDWMAWVLAVMAVSSAVVCAQALRARMGRRDTARPFAAVALVIGIAILLWAVLSYVQGATEVSQILSVVTDNGSHAQIEATARLELSSRFALSVAASLPALVLGIVFLGTGRRTSATAR